MTTSVGAAGRSWRLVSPDFGVTTNPRDWRRITCHVAWRWSQNVDVASE